MNKNFEIVPYVSVGEIQFGMTIEQLKKVFGSVPEMEYYDPVMKVTKLTPKRYLLFLTDPTETNDMDKKIYSILKKIYFHENGFYNLSLDRHEHKVPTAVTQADLKLLEINGLKPNNFETFEHDNTLGRLLKLRENKKLTLDFVTAMFIKGVTGELPRARQTLMSYLYLKHLCKHDFVGKANCEICGLPKVKTEDKTHQLYTYYLGHSWNETPLNFLTELEEALTFEKPEITKSDRKKLDELVEFISNADDKETPGKLEKRIASEKILEQTDKYKRYGILQTLAECGILPNKFISPKYEKFSSIKELWEASKKLTTSHRSDIILPLGGWKGENGVNTERFNEIFNAKTHGE
ncbi:hypothetical protein SAMN04487898_12211 [Pedobacter sp. ok626]|nr:hypothetical protein SAMN04487898_12211 [Pedobacter sp. ok626]